jgi:hypothetical protein
MAQYYTILAKELWLSYFCCGSRWSPPEWMDLEAGDKALALLDRLGALMAEAQSLATDPLDAYRLSRPAAQFRVLDLMGRAAARNNPLVLDCVRAEKDQTANPANAAQDKAALITRLKAAINHDEQVINPAIAALCDRKDGTIAAWMAGRMMHGAAHRMKETLARLEA